MTPAPKPQDEEKRIQSLRRHQLLDTLPEDAYDDITKIASEICGTPISLLTLVDNDRQWFKSRVGLPVSETSRDLSFCAHAIVSPGEIFLVEDARYDERFHDNPLVHADPKVVFYAGVPITDTEGHALGTLCVIDSRPRELNPEKLDSLKALGKLANAYLELRLRKLELEDANKTIQNTREVAGRLTGMIDALKQQGVENSILNELQSTADELKR